VKSLSRSTVEVTVIDRQNHHCFQPLLYQVATAALSTGADISAAAQWSGHSAELKESGSLSQPGRRAPVPWQETR
jgi:NADH dehydrogenase FAD-containing subunit